MEGSVRHPVQSLHKKRRCWLMNVTSASGVFYFGDVETWFGGSASYKDVLFLQGIDDPAFLTKARPYLRCTNYFWLSDG